MGTEYTIIFFKQGLLKEYINKAFKSCRSFIQWLFIKTRKKYDHAYSSFCGLSESIIKNLLTRLSSPRAASEGLPGRSSSVEPCLLREEFEKWDSAECTDIESHPNRVPIRLRSRSVILKKTF